MRLRLLALFALTTLVAAACDTGDPVDVDDPTAEVDETAPTDEEPDDAEEPAAVGGTLVAAIGGHPDRLDPHPTTSSFAFTVLENAYDTLVEPGDDLTMEPALAESSDISDDLLTWTFTLRDGVTFHDGSELTADDVVASFERIADEGQNAFRLAADEEFNAPDDLTGELVLDRPAPNLLEQVGPFQGHGDRPGRGDRRGHARGRTSRHRPLPVRVVHAR